MAHGSMVCSLKDLFSAWIYDLLPVRSTCCMDPKHVHARIFEMHCSTVFMHIKMLMMHRSLIPSHKVLIQCLDLTWSIHTRIHVVNGSNMAHSHIAHCPVVCLLLILLYIA